MSVAANPDSISSNLRTPGESLVKARSARRSSLAAFTALLARDLHVLRNKFGFFIIRTAMQPLLVVFVFTYVFPKIGQGVGGGGQAVADFSSLMVPGVVATACIFQGIQAIALPLVEEFGYTKEIEDRVLAPLPVWGVAFEKVVAAALQGLVASLIVFPLALFIPATPVHLSVNWLLLITITPLACLLGASVGLAIGTRVAPNQVPLMFSVVVIPMTFLGATYYPWAALEPVAWLKWAVLVNPLIYMSEGFRASLTPHINHMPLWGIYLALIGYTAFLCWIGINGFKKRVLT